MMGNLPMGLAGVNDFGGGFGGPPPPIRPAGPPRFCYDDFSQLSGQRPNVRLVRPNDIDGLIVRRKRLEVPKFNFSSFSSERVVIELHLLNRNPILNRFRPSILMSVSCFPTQLSLEIFLLLHQSSCVLSEIELKSNRKFFSIRLN